MDLQQLIEEQREENEEIVEALLEDGSNAQAEHTLEHHFFCTNFDRLEKLAVDAFKMGFEVSDAEEAETDDGMTFFCCDVIGQLPLDLDKIHAQTDAMFKLAEKFNAEYDGWGTYFVE